MISTMCILVIFAKMLNPFMKLRLFQQWEKRIDIHPVVEISNTTQYIKVLRNYVEIEYCAKHQDVLDNNPHNILSNNHLPS